MCNAILWGGFEISAQYSEEISSLPLNFRILDGLFQALCMSFSWNKVLTLANDTTAVRSGGFSVVAFDRLPQGLLIVYGTYPL